jgi:hypothetical protein
MAITINDIKPTAHCDCSTGVVTLIELPLAAKQAKIARIEANLVLEEAARVKKQKQKDALDILKLDKKNEGLLVALGLIEPPETVK